MSRENVEVVRALLEAWNSGDMEAVSENLASDVIARPPEGWPEPGPFVGREAVMRQWERVREAFTSDTLELTTDAIDLGHRVLARVVWRGVGHGPESAMKWTNLVTVRSGKVTVIEYFWEHAQALEAAGLSE